MPIKNKMNHIIRHIFLKLHGTIAKWYGVRWQFSAILLNWEILSSGAILIQAVYRRICFEHLTAIANWHDCKIIDVSIRSCKKSSQVLKRKIIFSKEPDRAQCFALTELKGFSY
jgi:hypothetical protein